MSSGDTVAKFFPYDNEPPSSNYAYLDTRNGHPVLVYTTAGATGIFSDVMPQVYTSAGMTIKIHWVVASATTNSAEWVVSLERDTAQDIDSDGFATAVTAAAVSANATSGIPSISTVDVSGASLDGIGKGDLYRLKVTGGTGTTVTDNIQLLAVEIRET